MMGPGTTRARLVVAVFTLAMIYASFCSTACAIGACPNLARHSESRDCDHSSSGHSQNSHHHGPENSKCAEHGHPGTFALMGAGIAQFQFTSADRVNAAAPLILSFGTPAFALSGSWISDLAPPPNLNTPVYQQSSVLRI
jgi:hypothetical protein